MRQIVRIWSNNVPAPDQIKGLIQGNVLGKHTRTRGIDVLRRSFSHRFLMGDPPDAWKIARALEDHEPSIEIVRPVYYWVTARSDALLYDFATDQLKPKAKNHDLTLRVDDTVSWIKARLKGQRQQWSDTVTVKVARGLLAALRDFGMLEGADRKKIAPAYLPVEAFAYIAFCLFMTGKSGQRLVHHSDWGLFLLDLLVVERLFMDAHQHGLLRYDAAGNLYRIDFFAQTHKEMAHVVTRSLY
jgi:hypothetical protein